MKLFILGNKFMLFSENLFFIFNFNPFLSFFWGLENFLLNLSLMILKKLMMFFKPKIFLKGFFIFCISEKVLGVNFLNLKVWFYGKGFLKSLKVFQS
uniref:NADH dehydrogenase subunit 4L n=1 Tax=Macropodaphis sp. YW-2015 TaxID=1667255 RepID=A0A1L1YMJ9_9HEMI|nr:NADH dehydrogenase subunit 4L [Macropodaphis sp. YW-2015]